MQSRSGSPSAWLGDLSVVLTPPRSEEVGDEDRAALAGLRGRPVAQVRGWIARRREAEARRAALIWKAAFVVIGLLGALAGAGATSAVLRFDAQAPVNVFHVLGVLVAPQVAFFLLWVVWMLAPVRESRAWRSLAEAWNWLHPGVWMMTLVRRLGRKSVARAWDAVREHAAAWRILTATQRWAVGLGGQTFALGFALASLLTLLVRVAGQDLYFGWSTTLDVGPESVRRMTGLIAAPWAWRVPTAAPGADLIEATRYYRLEGMVRADPAVWGRWWPFLAWCLGVYAVLPRLVSWVVTRHRLAASAAKALALLPGAVEVVERLNPPHLDTRVADAEPTPGDGEGSVPAELSGGGSVSAVVAWGGLSLAPDALRQAVGAGEAAEVRTAGAGGPWREDEATARTVAALADGGTVRIAVKAWEPPLGEFEDFLRAMRKAMGRAGRIEVVLGPWPEAGLPVAATEEDIRVWSGFLARLGLDGLAWGLRPDGGAT